MAGSTRYEIETNTDWGLQNLVSKINKMIDETPDLNAAFDVVSLNMTNSINDLTASIKSLAKVRSTNGDARLIEEIIEPSYGYSMTNKILLSAAFDHAKKNGHDVTYRQKANGHFEARICPKPQ